MARRTNRTVRGEHLTQDAANKSESNNRENNPQTEQEAASGDETGKDQYADDEDAKKFDYTVNTAGGVYVDGEPIEVGKTVSFTHKEARRHTDAGISLTLADEDERKRLATAQANKRLAEVNDAPLPDEHV